MKKISLFITLILGLGLSLSCSNSVKFSAMKSSKPRGGFCKKLLTAFALFSFAKGEEEVHECQNPLGTVYYLDSLKKEKIFVADKLSDYTLYLRNTYPAICEEWEEDLDMIYERHCTLPDKKLCNDTLKSILLKENKFDNRLIKRYAIRHWYDKKIHDFNVVKTNLYCMSLYYCKKDVFIKILDLHVIDPAQQSCADNVKIDPPILM